MQKSINLWFLAHFYNLPCGKLINKNNRKMVTIKSKLYFALNFWITWNTFFFAKFFHDSYHNLTWIWVLEHPVYIYNFFCVNPEWISPHIKLQPSTFVFFNGNGLISFRSPGTCCCRTTIFLNLVFCQHKRSCKNKWHTCIFRQPAINFVLSAVSAWNITAGNDLDNAL